MYLIKSFAMRAGVERVICDKMNYLAEHGYTVVLVTYEQGNHLPAYQLHPDIMCHDLDTRFFTLGSYRLFRRFVEYIKMRVLFKERLQCLVNDINPDIIITTTYQLKVLDIILKVRTQAKKIIESHIACYKIKKTTEYGKNVIMRSIVQLYDNYFLSKINKFEKLIVLTHGDSEEWKRYINNVVIIPNPLTFYPDDINECKLHRRIISVGRLQEQKGYDMLIQAFLLIADKCVGWKLDIFGEGSDYIYLNQMIVDNGLEDSIKINKPTTAIYNEYANSDFYVLSSRYEGYPLVLNEAMSCGLPCVSFACKYGPEEAIIHGKNGLLVEMGNVEKLSEAIYWMITHTQERQIMGQQARILASRYKKEIIMQKWIDLFESFG